MVDLHCHILHDIDDGSSSLEESIELCRIACGSNIDRIVVTPHLMDLGDMETLLNRRDRRIRELRAALEPLELMVQLFPGTEVLAGDELFYLDHLERAAINGSRYLLIEFPFSGLSFSTMRRYLAEVRSRELVPILAHPERYPYFQRNHEQLYPLMEDGVLLQVNASSLCRGGSRAEYKLARELLRQQAASFLATDAHSVNYRPNNLLDMLFSIPPEIDSDYIEELVNINPELVLQNKRITPRQG